MSTLSIQLRLVELSRDIKKGNWSDVNSSLEILSVFGKRVTDEELIEMEQSIIESSSMICELANSLRSNISRLSITLIPCFIKAIYLMGRTDVDTNNVVKELLDTLFKRTNATQTQRTLHYTCIIETRAAATLPIQFTYPVVAQIVAEDSAQKLSTALCNFVSVSLINWSQQSGVLGEEVVTSLKIILPYITNMMHDKRESAKTLAKACVRVIVLALWDHMDTICEPVLRNELLAPLPATFPANRDLVDIQETFGIKWPELQSEIESSSVRNISHFPDISKQKMFSGGETSRTTLTERRLGSPSPRSIYNRVNTIDKHTNWLQRIPIPVRRVVR